MDEDKIVEELNRMGFAITTKLEGIRKVLMAFLMITLVAFILSTILIITL